VTPRKRTCLTANKADTAPQEVLASSDVKDAVNVNANIYAATIKMPDFWQHNPQLWFQHILAQFQLRGITQDVMKYFHVVAALDASTMARAMVLLEAPPATGK